MRFRIYTENEDGEINSFDVEGETVEECQQEAERGEMLRGWVNCWAVKLKGEVK